MMTDIINLCVVTVGFTHFKTLRQIEAEYIVEAFFMDTHYYLYWGEGWGLGLGSMGHLIHLGLPTYVKG